MAANNRSYLEIKVTFIHIFVLLVAVVIIGIFLFYLGFQAGKSSLKNQMASRDVTPSQGATEEITIDDPDNARAGSPVGRSAIDREIRMHSQPEETPEEAEKKIETKPLVKEDYYSIQVGAFAEYSNAKRESDRFGAMGYETEIMSVTRENRKLFRVRVGRFSSREAATREKEKLEKKLKRTFTVTTSG